MEWISVKDRLPSYERDTPCLVLIPVYSGSINAGDTPVHYTIFVADWEPEFQSFEQGSRATHWMPLPQVPSEFCSDSMKGRKETISISGLQAIVNYIDEGDPDISVIKSELEELILRATGEYWA